MSKKAKTIFMLVGAGAVALLVVLALFGNTYARYTSTGDGGGTMSVALWDLESTSSWDAGSTVEAIRPSDDDYGDTARTNSNDWIELFTVTNYSDVDARVELTGGSGVTLDWAADFAWDVGWNGTGDFDSAGNPVGRAQMNAYAQKLMARFGTKDAFEAVVEDNGVFAFRLGYKADGEGDVTAVPDEGLVLGAAVEGVGTTYAVYAAVVWTSVYGTDTLPTSANDEDSWSSWKEYSDAVDTLLCMYVESVSFSTAWTAYQASAT